jgi:hypothetical protein
MSVRAFSNAQDAFAYLFFSAKFSFVVPYKFFSILFKDLVVRLALLFIFSGQLNLRLTVNIVAPFNAF